MVWLGAPSGVLARQSPLAVPHEALVFPQLRVAPFDQAPLDLLMHCRWPQAPQCLTQFYRRRSFIYRKQPKATARYFRDVTKHPPYACHDWRHVDNKPRVRIAFPEFRFGSVSSLPGSDSDWFRRARFGVGSVSPGQVRIRIGFAEPESDSDSDRIPDLHHGTGSGSILETPAGLIAY